MKYGYARVSTDDQNLALQLTTLRRAGCSAQSIFRDDGFSGATTERAGLHRCLETVQPADTLVVWNLDRLARPMTSAESAPPSCARIIDEDIYEPGAPVPDLTSSPYRDQFMRDVVQEIEAAAGDVGAQFT